MSSQSEKKETEIKATVTPGKRFLVTAALPYSNGGLHVGHIAGAYLPADIFVRYLRLAGADVMSICGSDDHGVAMMIKAQKEGTTPDQVSKKYNTRQKADLEGLGINFDIYGATSQNPYHHEASQHFFKRLFEQGYFEKKEVQQFYDDSKQMFLPDRFVKGTCAECKAPDQNGDQCEQCGKMLDVDTLLNPVSALSGQPAVIKTTRHWFLDLSKFEPTVRQWLEKALIREHTSTYVKGLLSTGLVKRSMTRDLTWGIPVPLEDPDAKGKVLYVWFDAPIGYVSNTMELCQQKYGDKERYVERWKSKDCEIFHFIGEDNTIFHTVIWIAMLSAEGSFQLPRGVIVNHFLNIKFPNKEVEKISKSRGSAIWIEDHLAHGGNADILRYYLTAVAPEQARTVYRPDEVAVKNNNELGNVLGNLVNRVLTFTRKYCGPAIPEYDQKLVSDRDRAFTQAMETAHKEITELMNSFSFRAAIERIMEFGRECNRYLDDKAPWTTRKTDMEVTKVSLAYGIHAIRFLSVMLAPFMPQTAAKIAEFLSQDPAKLNWNEACAPLPAGTPLAEPQILFPKIETEEEKKG